MKKLEMTWSVLAIAVLCCEAAFGEGAISPATFVTVDPSASIIWKTATEWPLKVQLDWPEDAVKAVVTVTDAQGRSLGIFEQSDITAKELTIDGQAPKTEAEETVATLELAYLNGQGEALAFGGARLGFVRGVGENGARAVTSPMDSAFWRRLSGSLVCELPKNAAGLEVDGVPVADVSAPDWFVASVSDGETKVYSLLTADGRVDMPIVYCGIGLIFLLK